MSGNNSSFEDRLARISEKKAQSGSAMPPPELPKPPRRSGGSGGGRFGGMAMALAVGFFVVSAAAFVFLFVSDRPYVALAAAGAEREIEGKGAGVSNLLSNDDMLNAIYDQSVRDAEERVASGTLAGEELRKTEAFIAARKGKSVVDAMRSNMTPLLMHRAQAAGQTAMAEDIGSQMAACQTTNCLSYVHAKFHVRLTELGH